MQIAVLGAGVMGVSAAEWLRRDGHQVTLIDRVEPGDPAQTSYGNAGILAASAVVPVPVPGIVWKAPGMLLDPDGPLFLKWSYLPRLLPWLARYLASGRLAEVERISRALVPLIGDCVEDHKALAAGTGAERYIGPERYTHLFRDRAAYEADPLAIRLRAEAGIETEEIERGELVRRDPGIGAHYGFGVAFGSTGTVRNPGAYVCALYEHFRREGGRFLRAEVEDVAPGSAGVRVTAGGETLGFDRAVLAMGAWSGRLMRRLGHDAGLESERGYHLLLKGPSRMPPVPYMLSEQKFVAAPMEMGLRLAGLDEFGGLDAPPSKGPTALQRRGIRRLYPDLSWEGEEVWMGHRPSTIDSLPVLGESGKAPNVVFAFGGQHLGLTMGPRTGRIVADLIAGRRPNIDLAPYRPGRFDRR